MFEPPVVSREDYEGMTHEEQRKLYTTVELTVPVYLPLVVSPDGYRAGKVTFKTFCTDVTDDDGNEIGMIGGGLGAVTISHKKYGGDWMISHADLWHAFEAAMKEALNESK